MVKVCPAGCRCRNNSSTHPGCGASGQLIRVVRSGRWRGRAEISQGGGQLGLGAASQREGGDGEEEADSFLSEPVGADGRRFGWSILRIFMWFWVGWVWLFWDR